LIPRRGWGLLAACGKLDSRARLIGVERDAATFQRAKVTAPTGTRLILADYLKSNAGLFDGIIANPPYVKAHRLEYSEADWRYFEERLGTPLDRLTNLYALFLLKIWEDLGPGGRGAVILPAEFLNANFGEEIKQRLVQVIRPAALLIFDPSVSLFADALTTSALVFLQKPPPAPAGSWLKRVESVTDAERFMAELSDGNPVHPGADCLDLTTLEPRHKWLNALFGAGIAGCPWPKHVGDYFDCTRGIATRANDDFCLRPSELRAHGLTSEDVEPCLTKAADAEGLVFTPAKFNALVAGDRRCFLLNPLRQVSNVTRYLALGEQRGIPRRHLPSHRRVWYLPEKRPPADILVSVFSRGYPKFILNLSGAKNLTCFHGLYAKPGFETLPPLMTLFLNTSAGRRSFAGVNRFYGDGLHKVEPRDVEQMPCPAMPKLSRADADHLIGRLLEIETLPLPERTVHLEALAARYF
jgi:adenine-specific DNA-methyltransferase